MPHPDSGAGLFGMAVEPQQFCPAFQSDALRPLPLAVQTPVRNAADWAKILFPCTPNHLISHKVMLDTDFSHGWGRRFDPCRAHHWKTARRRLRRWCESGFLLAFPRFWPLKPKRSSCRSMQPASNQERYCSASPGLRSDARAKAMIRELNRRPPLSSPACWRCGEPWQLHRPRGAR